MTLLTIREASQLIGRTPATIRRYIRSGRLKAAKEIGKFGEEYKIARDDLLALGFCAAPSDLPVRVERVEPPIRHDARPEARDGVPASVFNELLMKHEQILVQYGMIRAGGQKLLEYKAEAEARAEDLARSQERYQALRAQAAREIKHLRSQLRQREIEIEERNIEIMELQDRLRRPQASMVAPEALETFDSKVVEIRERERAIARLEAGEPRTSPSYTLPEAWLESFPPGSRGEDH